MKEKIAEFKKLWFETKSYISLELTDKEIAEFISMTTSLEMAIDRASDYLLSSGLADVVE